jgi:hypothetical protein
MAPAMYAAQLRDVTANIVDRTQLAPLYASVGFTINGTPAAVAAKRVAFIDLENQSQASGIAQNRANSSVTQAGTVPSGQRWYLRALGVHVLNIGNSQLTAQDMARLTSNVALTLNIGAQKQQIGNAAMYPAGFGAEGGINNGRPARESMTFFSKAHVVSELNGFSVDVELISTTNVTGPDEDDTVQFLLFFDRVVDFAPDQRAGI